MHLTFSTACKDTTHLSEKPLAIYLSEGCGKSRKEVVNLKRPGKGQEATLGFMEGWKESFEKFNLPSSWGSPKADLWRIEKEIDEKMANVIAPREFPDLGFWYYNRHDIDHIKRVIGYLYEILKTRKIKLRPHEQYFLYLAAYGHDLGMTIWNDSLKEAYERALGRKMDTFLMRKTHGVASGNIIEDILKPYIKNPEALGVIREIVSYHCGEIENIEDLTKERIIDGKKIRIGLLIALLRIADTMDAGEQRLPDEEIIATSLALSSTCEPLQGQFEHYMRRKIVETCHCNKEGILLKVRSRFKKFVVKSPVGKKGKSICVTGKDAFLGVLEEFGKELGSPENLDELEEKFPDLAWDKLEDVWKKQTSNRLLEKYKLKIPWIVDFFGHPYGAIPVNWESKAEKKRKGYDKDPHSIETLLAKRGIIKPPIKSLMLIKEALAAQDIKPDPFRPGRLFWPDIEGLLKRDEIDKILRCFTKDNVVLMEGYPASGKSSIACRLGYELVKESKWVYYGNLTTRVGLNCQPEELSGKLREEVEEVKAEVFIIIEDIHHTVKEFDNLNFITDHKHIKLLLTSRPLKQSDVEKYSDHGEISSRHFQWISPQNRIDLKTDKDVVERILRKGKVPFSDLGEILNTIGKDKPNLLLISFLVQASKRKGKRVDEIGVDEVRRFVIDHLNELRERVCDSSDKEMFGKLIGTLSVLSEFEVPVEKKFLDGGSVGNLLKKLEKEREILCLKGRFFGEEYYLIPHSRLASVYRSVCSDDTNRREILKRYIFQGEFFGVLMRRLCPEEISLLRGIIEASRKELVRRHIFQADIIEIGSFLRGIAWADIELAKEIARENSDTLKQKDLSQADMREIEFFLREISLIDRDVVREIVRVHSNALKQKDPSQADIEEIVSFVSSIYQGDKKLSREIVRVHSDILKQKDLSQANIAKIAYFIGWTAWADKELAREIVRVHNDTLKQKLRQVDIETIKYFLWHIGLTDKELVREIVRAHEEVLKRKMAEEKDPGTKISFIKQIKGIDPELAERLRG